MPGREDRASSRRAFTRVLKRFYGKAATIVSSNNRGLEMRT